MLLIFMAQNQGKALNRQMLLEHVWERNLDLLETTVNVHMCKLREKIDKGYEVKLIHTLHGGGYKLEMPETVHA